MITVFSARLYGSRSCKNQQLMENLTNVVYSRTASQILARYFNAVKAGLEASHTVCDEWVHGA